MSRLPETPLHLLEPRTGTAAAPSQFGVPWPRGVMPQPPQFDLVEASGSTPVDTWVTARWPDGSVKWTGHAGLAPAGDAPARVEALLKTYLALRENGDESFQSFTARKGPEALRDAAEDQPALKAAA